MVNDVKWWLIIWLVVFFLPLWKMMEWSESQLGWFFIPNWMESHKIPWFQSPPDGISWYIFWDFAGWIHGNSPVFHEKSMEKGGVQRSSRSKVWNSALQTTKNEEDFRKQGMNEGWRLDVEGGFLFTFHHWGMWWAEIHHQNLGVWPSLAV